MAHGPITTICINLFIMDGVSDLTMRREMSALYKDLRAPLPTPLDADLLQAAPELHED